MILDEKELFSVFLIKMFLTPDTALTALASFSNFFSFEATFQLLLLEF